MRREGADGRPRDGSAALGVILVVLGALFLAGQALNLDLERYGWPLFIIVPGVALLAYGILVGGAPSGWLLIPGSIATSTGLLLLYQNSTAHWESWAYAWALIAPGSVGVALLLRGALSGRAYLARAGTRLVGIGLTIFVVGAAFFEGVLRISGRDFGLIGRAALPALLIGAGVFLLLERALPERWRPTSSSDKPAAGTE